MGVGKIVTLVFGGDGYIGWPLAVQLASTRNEEIVIVDNLNRREWVRKVESDSLTPIQGMGKRLEAYQMIYGKDNLTFHNLDARIPLAVDNVLQQYKPDCIIHLAQMPSAPYSMQSNNAALETLKNNTGSCLNILWSMKKHTPNSHLILMGTAGEYGTPNIPIAEGDFEIEYRGRKDTLPFPMQPGSFYHCTKSFDNIYARLASKTWGLRITNINQGIVYGVRTDATEKAPAMITLFDYDSYFATALNRFVSQALARIPLTVYGKGGQKRGFINIRDSIKCFELYIDNPAKHGEFRTFNQLTEDKYTIQELAEKVVGIGKDLGLKVKIENIENPRTEKEEHYYEIDHSKIKDLGLKPHSFDKSIKELFDDLAPYISRLKPGVVLPKTKWG